MSTKTTTTTAAGTAVSGTRYLTASTATAGDTGTDSSTTTTYNVITPEQLMHFKPMICVDNNGFISGNVIGDLTGDGKATHIVFQQATPAGTTSEAVASALVTGEVNVIPDSPESRRDQQHQLTNGGSGGGGGGSSSSGAGHSSSTPANWTEILNMDVLPVRCKTTTAELYKNRLGSGGRGRCIKYRDNWYTPSEFEMQVSSIDDYCKSKEALF